jgi:ATP-dependent RNA helicase DeaD
MSTQVARVVSCVGGMDVRREQRALAQGAHIVVGTPGRLRDHLERGKLDTSALARRGARRGR